MESNFKLLKMVFLNPIKFTRMLMLFSNKDRANHLCDNYISNIDKIKEKGGFNEYVSAHKYGKSDHIKGNRYRFSMYIPKDMNPKLLDGCALANNMVSEVIVSSTRYDVLNIDNNMKLVDVLFKTPHLTHTMPLD
ncbi:Hypothetical protein ORPV_289 [Orpheovirus IHUMI-LCC2]|uniref:Uncharacterized protein n=1 Tax=Orpheovirus IHUMI-LCC2 TaxID=2023057 RepID=A0A2I2L3U3_9VIRU|nr:Hypothetical protein ORPV_289 [Orpheovirus IHUMI-LCC2]SNW62193.1 Hypothetical protein ORPV_289 [Orpheovirus IHUMI-LCC2]